MSLSILAPDQGQPPPARLLAQFRRHAPDGAIGLARSIIDGMSGMDGVAGIPDDEPGHMVRDAAGALDEYGAHLMASAVTGHDHAGLPEQVAALGHVDKTADVTIRHVRTGVGLVIFVSDAAGQPLGLVALPRREG